MVYKYPIEKSPVGDLLLIIVLAFISVFIYPIVGHHWFGKMSIAIFAIGIIISAMSFYSGLFLAPQKLIIEGNELTVKYYFGKTEKYSFNDLLRIDDHKTRWLWRDQYITKLVFNESSREVLIGKYLIGVDEFRRKVYSLSNKSFTKAKGNAT